MVLVKQGYSVTLVKHVVVIIVYEMLVRQSWSALLYTAGIRFSSLYLSAEYCAQLSMLRVSSVYCMLYVYSVSFSVETDG